MKDKIELAIDTLVEDKDITGYYPEVGVTWKSLHNAELLIKRYGIPSRLDFSFSDDEWFRVTATWANGKSHTFTGFAWGYRGEGPHGLLAFFQAL